MGQEPLEAELVLCLSWLEQKCLRIGTSIWNLKKGEGRWLCIVLRTVFRCWTSQAFLSPSLPPPFAPSPFLQHLLSTYCMPNADLDTEAAETETCPDMTA